MFLCLINVFEEINGVSCIPILLDIIRTSCTAIHSWLLIHNSMLLTTIAIPRVVKLLLLANNCTAIWNIIIVILIFVVRYINRLFIDNLSRLMIPSNLEKTTTPIGKSIYLTSLAATPIEISLMLIEIIIIPCAGGTMLLIRWFQQ